MHISSMKVAVNFIVLLGGLGAFAQTTVTTTGGTTNAVPKFSGSGTIVNSAITEANGGVSIGALQPYGILTVAPQTFVPDGQAGPANGIVFADRSGTYQWSQAAIYGTGSSGYNGNLVFATDGDGLSNFNPTEKMRIDYAGNIGVGTAAPQAKLHLYGDGYASPTLLLQSGGNGYPGLFFQNAAGSYTQQINGVDGSLYWWNTSKQNMVLLQNGNLGLGTATPGATLEVNGGIKLSSGSNGVITFADGTHQSTAATGSASGGGAVSFPDITDVSSNVSIGKAGSPVSLQVSGNMSATLYTGGISLRTNPGTQYTNTTIDRRLLREGIVTGDSSGGPLPYGLNLSSLPWTYGGDPITYHAGSHDFRVLAGGNTNEFRAMIIQSTGNIGIGVDNPGAKLEVNGNIKLTAGSGASVTFQDGSVQNIAWNGTIGGQDYADSVSVSGAVNNYEPGDILVIDAVMDRTFSKAAEPYSHLVAGVYSTKPGLVGHLHPSSALAKTNEVPLAMAGIVPAKVSAENGPIHRGDLLVASSTPGYAMKGTDPALLTGAVIGKALGTLALGKGVIEVLVTLQ